MTEKNYLNYSYRMQNSKDYENMTKDEMLAMLMKQNEEIQQMKQEKKQKEKPIEDPSVGAKMLKQFKEELEKEKKKKPKKGTIRKRDQAFGGYSQSFKIPPKNSESPIEQLTQTSSQLYFKMLDLLAETGGFKFMETMQVNFFKESPDGQIIQKSPYFNSTPRIT